MMEKVRKHFPDISHLVESTYGVEVVLNLGDTVILSSTGVHQDDPLASADFLGSPASGGDHRQGGPQPYRECLVLK